MNFVIVFLVFNAIDGVDNKCKIITIAKQARAGNTRSNANQVKKEKKNLNERKTNMNVSSQNHIKIRTKN